MGQNGKKNKQTGSTPVVSKAQTERLEAETIRTLVTLSGISYKKLSKGSNLLKKKGQSPAPVVMGHFDSLLNRSDSQQNAATGT